MQVGKRHPLLVFKTRYRKNRGLYIITALMSFGLYAALWLLPTSTWLNTPWLLDIDWLFLLLGIVALGGFIFRWVAGRIPYIQCSERNVKIQTPLYPIVLSYKRIHETRPNTLFYLFGNAKLSRGDRGIVLGDKVGGQTALVVDMVSWPMSRQWMKFWMSRLMFTADNQALVFWVEDWMTLNRELSDFKDRWRERQRRMREEHPTTSVANQLMRKKP